LHFGSSHDHGRNTSALFRKFYSNWNHRSFRCPSFGASTREVVVPEEPLLARLCYVFLLLFHRLIERLCCQPEEYLLLKTTGFSGTGTPQLHALGVYSNASRWDFYRLAIRLHVHSPRESEFAGMPAIFSALIASSSFGVPQFASVEGPVATERPSRSHASSCD